MSRYLNRKFARKTAKRQDPDSKDLMVLKMLLLMEHNGVLREPGKRKMMPYEATEMARDLLEKFINKPPFDEATIQRLMDAS